MVEAAMISFIDRVGIAAAAFIFMYMLYVQNQKWQQKQQEKTDTRFDNLVNLFITTVQEITEAHNKSMEKNTEALERHTTQLEEHVKSKDEFMTYIKEGKRSYG